nr:unnamed protein product [Callosobruchus chinensis]
MQNETVAVDQTVEMELGEVKVEPLEIDEVTWGRPAVKDETHDNTVEMGLQSVKDELTFDEACIDKAIKMQHSEVNLDCKQFEAAYITEEGIIIKEENDYPDYIDGNLEVVLNSSPKQEIPEQHHIASDKPIEKSYSCYTCFYTTSHKSLLIKHMQEHSAFLDSSKNLDDHIIRKHPDSIASISSKIHECEYCTYKTTVKGHLTEHMIQHTETADIYKLRCIHCDETFKRRTGLDEHIIKKHPHLIATVTSKIHECTYCAYQTVLKPHFARHISPEEEIQRRHFFVCEESNDVLYSCYKCDYITSQKYNLINHMEDHHSRNRSNIPVMCTDCNSAFRRKLDLDEHIIRKHPHLIATLNRTILKCTYCAYQTVLKHLIDRHMFSVVDDGK